MFARTPTTRSMLQMQASMSAMWPARALPHHVAAVFVTGLNFATHAEEVGLEHPKYPIFAMKPGSSVMLPPMWNDADGWSGMPRGSTIVVPKHLQDPPDADYEGELAVVIGKSCKNVPNDPAAVDSVVAGYTIAMDISSRRWQKRGGGQWCYAKSFDTWCPIGPTLVKFPVRDLAEKRIVTRLNGDVMQDDSFSSFIFDVPALVSFLSRGITLRPGTLILTGTPAGVGFTQKPPRYLAHGDRIAVKIDGIGELTCDVKYE